MSDAVASTTSGMDEPAAALVERLAGLPRLRDIPRGELEWLVSRGDLRTYEPGDIIGPKGERIEKLWIVVSGRIAIRVDRGAGPRRVMEWLPGDVSGMLPYSRMTGPPGDNFLPEKSEVLEVHERHFPDMVHSCPVLTAHTVHLMLDRARSFNASDLHDEKMISLGRLAAGLAHELNNPASATVRGAKLLLTGLPEAEEAARALGAAGLTPDELDAIEKLRATCLTAPGNDVLSPIEQADHEDEISDWLDRHQSDPSLATTLADTPITVEALDRLADAVAPRALGAALRWIAAGCLTRALAVDIERAATRIHELVASVRKFTYMDNRAGPEYVDVETGLRDTIRVVASKARAKGAAIHLDIEADLPAVHANAGEMNQVWLNLIDNALDAIGESGRIDLEARTELDRVIVRVIDDGPGIPEDVMPRIFDPFFTTKPPGQGTGLGLEITRRLLRRFRGDISVESRPGHTEFRVSLVAARGESADGETGDGSVSPAP